jgi:hypothetical protein
LSAAAGKPFGWDNDKPGVQFNQLVSGFGLIAEDLATVNPDLVARDEEGKIVTVRYQAVNAMLLNEFLKEHRKVEELEKQVEKLTA